ncbi:glycosyltransferase [Anaeromyxobacter diazotrophicus]|uniref:Glycosyltransferase subfamily 4-like N-terminal domain-containing protein n=1 Tax=Anaeromyxobacter diazotrophicus TaxID=2590199 RepID=A0A7I9VGA9_9BACT|nr:glycosyltransferase [Anaeromyxobacter diazotrophicus]GEJ55434.1 hypothetical protein AMYX_01750 [Anaeromyxobacter diazotrophicus]
MTQAREQQASTIDEVWFLSSELEGERAGAHRQVRWCRIFLEAGARIVIFNIRGAFHVSETRLDSLAAFETFRHRVLDGAKRVSGIREGALVPLLRRVKHLLLADMYLPNVARLFLRTRRRLVSGSARIAIMPSSPPFSVALVGAALKRLYPRRVLLALDMRDAWALHPELRGSTWLKRRIEQWVLRSADHVSTMSVDLADEMTKTHGVPFEVYYNVATHYFDVQPTLPIDWKALDARIDPARRKLVYTGSTPEGFYDVGALVGGVRQLRATRPDLADSLQLVFVGANAEVEHEVARQGGTGDSFVFTGLVPHEQAKAIQQNADAFLFFAFHRGGNKGIVSTKFFEYLALGKPVLPISVSKGSDIDTLLARFAGRSCRLNSAGEVAEALARVAEGCAHAHLPTVEEPGSLRVLAEDYRRFARAVMRGEAAPAGPAAVMDGGRG